MAPQSAVRVVDLTQVTYIRVLNCFIYLYRLHSTYFQTTAENFFCCSALRACLVSHFLFLISHFLFLISRFLFLRSWFYHYPGASRATVRRYRYRNFYFTVALRANVKPAHSKFKGLQFFHRAFYARLRFSATRDTTSSTDNHCPVALQRCQRLLNGTPYGYLHVRHRPAMCVSLP